MNKPLSAGARKIQDALRARRLENRVLELPDSTRTAKEAAAAVGCEIAQIVKSLIFKGAESKRPVLVTASGVNRVDEQRIAALLGEAIAKADAAYVRAKTGFTIGGVAPFGHIEPPTVFIDEDLFAYREIWAAAGTPNAVFRLTPQELQMLTSGRVVTIS